MWGMVWAAKWYLQCVCVAQAGPLGGACSVCEGCMAHCVAPTM
jgi:hypothetical protein